MRNNTTNLCAYSSLSSCLLTCWGEVGGEEEEEGWGEQVGWGEEVGRGGEVGGRGGRERWEGGRRVIGEGEVGGGGGLERGRVRTYLLTRATEASK